MANLTLEEKNQLKEDWKNRKTQKLDTSLDEEDKFVKNEIIPSEENDIFYTPNPEYSDNERYMQRYNMYKEQAKIKHPDNIEEQNKYLSKKKQSLDTSFIYGEQITGGVFDAIDSSLNFTVNRFLPEDYKLHMPETKEPENLKQSFVRGGIQFAIPFAGWWKVLNTGYKFLKGGKKAADTFKKSWAADFGLATGAGAITDVVHFEAEDPTLSNLIQQYPHLQNPITEFLSTNPDDPEAVNRFKRAIEGVGLGSFFPVIFRGTQKGFSYTRTKATEKIIKTNLKATDSGWNRRRDKKGDTIKGAYHARINEQDMFIDYNKATRKYDVTINNEVVHSYRTVKEAKKGIDNLLNNRENLSEGLKGKNKKDFDEKEPLAIVFRDKIPAKSFSQRLKDKWDNLQVRSYAAMRLFDQHHGSKLLGEEVFKGNLTKKGLSQLGKDRLGGYKEARLNAATAGIFEHAMKYGSFRWTRNGNLQKTGPGLKQILSPVDKDITSFMHFWAASRMLNLKRLDKATNTWVKDTEKIKKMWGGDKEVEKAFKNASKLGTKRSADGRTYYEILAEVDKFNDSILDFAKASQILDAEHLARLKKSPHYIPFYRDFTDISGGGGILGKGGLASVLNKKLKGAAIGKGKQTIEVVDHIRSTPEKTVMKKVTVDAYPLKDLVEGYLQNIFGIIRNSQRNRIMLNQVAHIEELVRQRARDLMRAGARKKEAIKQAEEEIGENWAKKLPTKLKRNQVNLKDGNLERQFKDMNIDTSNVEDLIFYAPERIILGTREFAVSKVVKGKRKIEVWRVSENQPFLFESWLGVNDKLAKFTGTFMKISGQFKNLLTRGVTYDPGFFAWANFLRDTVAAAILSKNAFIPIYSSGVGLIKQIRKNGIVKGKDGKALKNADGTDMRFQDMWEEFVLNGGSFGSTLLRSELNEQALKRLYKELAIPYKNVINRPQQILTAPIKGGGKIIRGYDDFVGIFEYASRFQEYSSLRQKGVGARAAAYQAREIATDFGMHGSSAMVRFLTQQVPFLNAGMQGLYRTARAFEGLTRGEKQFVGAKIVAALLGPSLFFRYLNKNNEEYDNLAPHIKDMNWTIPLKGGNFMYIPKPFEWGAMATILDRFWDTVGPQAITMDGKDLWWGGQKDFTWDNFVEIGSKVFSEQMRLDVTPQIIDPVIDLLINKRFTGSPITPNFIRNYMPTEEGYYPWSNAAIVNVWEKYNLATVTNLSPIAFEHMLKTYTGAMGQYFLDFVIDPMGRDNEKMFDAPTIEAELPFGLSNIVGTDPGIFQDWNRVPLIKRMFGVSPQRHTQTLLDAYKIEREVNKRVSALKRYEPGKPTANSMMYNKLLKDPYMQDILALDKALASQFDKLRKLSEMETKVWGEYQKDKTRIEKGDVLIKIRAEREKVSKNIISRIEGMGLDYAIPRIAVLPLTRQEVNLTEIKRIGLDEPKVMQNIPTKKRTTSEIVEGIKW